VELNFRKWHGTDLDALNTIQRFKLPTPNPPTHETPSVPTIHQEIRIQLAGIPRGGPPLVTLPAKARIRPGAFGCGGEAAGGPQRRGVAEGRTDRRWSDSMRFTDFEGHPVLPYALFPSLKTGLFAIGGEMVLAGWE
jgi:hypothetical protein